MAGIGVSRPAIRDAGAGEKQAAFIGQALERIGAVPGDAGRAAGSGGGAAGLICVEFFAESRFAGGFLEEARPTADIPIAAPFGEIQPGGRGGVAEPERGAEPGKAVGGFGEGGPDAILSIGREKKRACQRCAGVSRCRLMSRSVSKMS